MAYGVQQEVQTKRGLFPFPLRQGGKKFVLPWRRKRHTRLAELGDTVTGRDEIAQADKAYRDAIGGDEWPDWAEQGEEDDGEPYHTGGA